MTTILSQTAPDCNTLIRPNLWLTPTGAVVGYGAVTSPTGLYFCFTCGQTDCQHVQAVDNDWLAGIDSVEMTGRFCVACQLGEHCGDCDCCNSVIPFGGER